MNCKIELFDAYQCDDCDEKYLTASEALECCGMPHYTPTEAFCCPVCRECSDDIDGFGDHICRE